MTDPPDDLEDRDPGLAQQRTALAWTRTAISFAAVGGIILKRGDIVPGLIIIGLTPVIWELGRQRNQRPGRLKLVTATIVAVSLVALMVSLTYHP